MRRGSLGSRSQRSAEAREKQRQRGPLIAGDALVADLAGSRLSELSCALPSSLLALNLAHNALTSASLLNARSLVEVNLSHNRLQTLEGLGAATALEFLDASFNLLVQLDGLATLARLRFLAVRGNLISSLREVAMLSFNPALAELILIDNPCTALPDYRVSVFNALRSLVLLDGRVEPKRVEGYRRRYELAGTAGTHLAVSAVDPAALTKLLGSNSPTPVSGGPSAPSPSVSVSEEVKRSFSTRSREGNRAVARIAVQSALAKDSSKSRAVPQVCWMSPSIAHMCRLSLREPQDVDGSASLAIAALRVSLGRETRGKESSPKASTKDRGQAVPVSPTRLSSERKRYKDWQVLQRKKEVEDHESRLFGRSPPRTPRLESGSPRSVSPPPSPTRASLKRQERVAEEISRGEGLLEEYISRTPPTAGKRFFGVGTQIRAPPRRTGSRSPPPSPTRASLKRQS